MRGLPNGWTSAQRIALSRPGGWTEAELATLTRPVETMEDIARLYYGPGTPPAVITAMVKPASPVAAAKAPAVRLSPVLTDDELYAQLFGS